MAHATKITATLLVSAMALTACTEQPGQTNDNRNKGVVIGAVTGAIAGKVIGGDGKDARNGAIAGAIIGGLAGNELDKQEVELRNSIGSSGATITNTGDRLIVTLPEAITFDTNSAVVRASLRDDLADIARSMNNFPNTVVNVIGHTDSTGTSSFNQTLSNQRANSVASILIGNGVSSGRINAFGRGETDPIASNATVEGRAQNRRVEIIIRPTS